MAIRVACIGNMNNNLFSLVRWLRDFNIDAELLLFDKEAEHFLPQNDSINNTNKFTYVKKLSWGSSKSFFITSSKKITHDLEDYNVIVGCGLSPAFLAKAGLRLHIFSPYGSDLYGILSEMLFKFHWKTPARLILAYYQKKGIRNVYLCVTIPSNKDYKKAIQRLGIKNYGLAIPIIYSPEYNSEKFNNYSSVYTDVFIWIRKNYDIVIFNHCRQIWKTFVDKVSWKGNDILIRGFAQYLKKAKKKAVLVLFEYGPDVENSKKLIRDLDIEKSVIWLPKMPRKDIMFGLELADFGSDILTGIGTGTNGTCREVMALGKPLFRSIGFSPEEYKKITMRPFPPIINVRTPEEIAKHLLNYEKNPEAYQEIGKKAKEWFDKYMGIGLAEKWVYLISCIYNKKQIDINELNFD